jgi:hypothetical protein
MLIALSAMTLICRVVLEVLMKDKAQRSFVVALVVIFPLLAQAQWTSNGRDAMFTMHLPQAKKPETNAIFLISYDKQWSCHPAVSIKLLSGRNFGPPERETTTKKRDDQLSIVVDGRVFSAETKLIKYVNGLELAMLAPIGLVQALSKQPTAVIARLGAGMGGFDFSWGKGFSAANAAASANCS